jgi:S-adenosylmethionine/arginine decarboxylase-like enzyme
MENKLLVHKHLIIRAEVARPPQNESYFRVWLNFFIKSINMKIMMGPYVKYSNMVGNRGLTGAAIIETSHVVAHTWDEVSPALMQIDVYSCSEFNPEKVCEKIKKDFKAVKIEYKFIDREHDLKEISVVK